MAFLPYQVVQTKILLEHQPDVCFPVNNDDQSVSLQLSLGFSLSCSTSSITQQSSLPMMKRLSPSKRMELVNAARLFSLYLSAEDSASFINSWSSEKSKKRPRRIEVVAEQLNEPNKKNRKVQKKIERGPIVKNKVTEQLESCIRETIKGFDIKLVIQKHLYKSDLLKSQNRLNMPINQLETKDFLTDEEKTNLETGKEIVVPLLGPTLRMHDEPMKLKIWHLPRSNNLVLINKWNEFVEENKFYLKKLSTVQVWSFRVDHQLCFALPVVERPMDNGVDEVA